MQRLPSLRLTLQVVLAVFCGGSASATEKPSITQPNIVLILATDLGYGDVHCYNDQSRVPTPHIDRLAREGMRFTDAHSPCTVCTPTRYSLMTGQMAFRVPHGGTVFTGVGGPSLIAPGRLTLPSMLRDNGYATACVGKWHVGVTGGVKGLVKQLLKIKDGVRIFLLERNGNHRQCFTDSHWPQTDFRAFITAADYNGVVALSQAFNRHLCAAAQQIDLHKMHVARQQQFALGKVLFPIAHRGKIRRT